MFSKRIFMCAVELKGRSSGDENRLVEMGAPNWNMVQ